MPEVRVSELSASSADLDGTEILHVVQGDVSKRTTTRQVAFAGERRYVAVLNQTGTAAPVATVIYNTLGEDVVWSRTGAGDYLGTAGGAVFTGGRTVIRVGGFTNNVRHIDVQRVSDTALSVGTSEVEEGNYTPADDYLIDHAIEIAVYPE